MNGRTNDPIAPPHRVSLHVRPDGTLVEQVMMFHGGFAYRYERAARCIDPNAEMQQRDAQGVIEEMKRINESCARRLADILRQLDALRSPDDEHEARNLGTVAPMHHRLGRFKC